MELTYDWRGFQELFYPHRRGGPASSEASPGGPVYLVVDRGVVVTAFSDSEDLSDWVGAPYEDIAGQNRHRSLFAFDRAQVDRCVAESLPLGQFYDQVEYLRSASRLIPEGSTTLPEALPTVPAAASSSTSKGKAVEALRLEVNRHFLIDGVRGWWRRVLPSSYGLFLRITGLRGEEQDFLVLVKGGSFDGFHEPDFTSLGVDRRRQPADVVRYLSERYLVPVQGVFVTSEQWQRWSQDSNPWMEVTRAITSKQAKLVPFRWSMAGLMGVRAVFGL